MAQITYADKTALNVNSSIADINKVNASDMNEIKSVVNTNDSNIGDLSSLATDTKTSIVGAINEIKNAEAYSTSEVKTNNVWIDGKPIYRKTFTGTLSSAINHGLTNVNFVNAYGFYVSSTGTFLPLPSLRPNNTNFNVGFYITSTQIAFDKGTGASGNCYITLEYTKTS